jgi:hypothetical protein
MDPWTVYINYTDGRFFLPHHMSKDVHTCQVSIVYEWRKKNEEKKWNTWLSRRDATRGLRIPLKGCSKH